MESAGLIIAGPVVVSILDHATREATTVAVGRLEDGQPGEGEDGGVTRIVSIGADWTFGLHPELEIVADGTVFLIPASTTQTFAVALPPNVLEIEAMAWSKTLELAGCVVLPGPVPPGFEGVVHFGDEFDKCGAEEFAFEGVRVPKGGSLCRPVELDASGWFYWVGGNGCQERTRPTWKHTNCVTCRRCADTRRITWQCFLVPSIGEAPHAVKDALETSKAEAAAKSVALWARRKQRISNAASAGFSAVTGVQTGTITAAATPCADELDDGSLDPEVAALAAAGEAAEVGQEAFVNAAKALVAIAITGYPRAIVSTRSKRNSLLRRHFGDAETAAREVMAKNGSFKDEAKHYLLALVPGIGIPAAVVYPLWIRLRRVCLVAALFGHDLQDDAVQAKIMYAAAGIEGGYQGHMANNTLQAAIQAVWRATAGPVTKFLPVGAVVGMFVGIEGRINEAVLRAFQDGPGVTELEYMLTLDQAPTMNEFLQLIKDGGAQTMEQVVIEGAKRAGVDRAQEIGAVAAAKQAASHLAKQAGAAIVAKSKERTESKEAKARLGSA